ncbi:MAG TPA: hypothetical protein VHO90_19050 [Bacteroidales bacterium]|nr:hypothetical protein [Bacteroidales bacterium]
MAQIRKNIITQGTSGSIDRKIVFKQYGDRIIMSAFPDRSKVRLSDKQKKENKRFSQAVAYARSQIADPVSKAEYKSRATGLQSAYNVAITDFYTPPSIMSINTAAFNNHKNDPLFIHATDDFKVVSVVVTIAAVDSVILESDDAVQLDRWNWEYRLQAPSLPTGKYNIIAQAWDKPGNRAQFEIELSV